MQSVPYRSMVEEKEPLEYTNQDCCHCGDSCRSRTTLCVAWHAGELHNGEQGDGESIQAGWQVTWTTGHAQREFDSGQMF